MPILVWLPNLNMGGTETADPSYGQYRTATVAGLNLSLNSGDKLRVRMNKISGSVTVKTVADGSSLTVRGR